MATGRTNSSKTSGYLYPPADCTGFIATQIPGEEVGVKLKWSDPDDAAVGKLTFVKWAGTKLIRKEGGYPQNEKDGSLVLDSKVRNQYQTDFFTDASGTQNSHYALFPYSADGIVNRNLTAKAQVLVAKPILADNDWDTIIRAAESGNAANLWNIGDEVDIALSWSRDKIITLQIAGFNHDDLADGSGKAGITFITKKVIMTAGIFKNGTNDWFWHISDVRNTTMATIYNAMDQQLRDAIKPVIKPCGGYNITEEGKNTVDTIFLPSEVEVTGNNEYSYPGEGTKYPIFTDVQSRIKKLGNSNWTWWTRSPKASIPASKTSKWDAVNTDGRIVTNFESTADSGIVPAFCI